MKKLIIIWASLLLFRPAPAQPTGSPPLDDDFLNFLVGDWIGTSILPRRDQPGQDRSTVGWGLNHQFLIFREVIPPTGSPQFELHGYMTYDRARRKYRSFWFDASGMAYQLEGERHGEQIRWQGMTPLGKSVCVYTREGPSRFRISLQVQDADGKWQSRPDIVRERRTARRGETP